MLRGYRKDYYVEGKGNGKKILQNMLLRRGFRMKKSLAFSGSILYSLFHNQTTILCCILNILIIRNIKYTKILPKLGVAGPSPVCRSNFKQFKIKHLYIKYRCFLFLNSLNYQKNMAKYNILM